MANFFLYQNDTKSKYSESYGPTEGESDGALVTVANPIRVFARRGKGVAVKLGVRGSGNPNISIDTVPNVDLGFRHNDGYPVPNNLVTLMPDNVFPDEKITMGSSHSITEPLSVGSVSSGTNTAVWFLCRSHSPLVRKTYNLWIHINSDAYPLILTIYDPVDEFEDDKDKYVSDQQAVFDVTESERRHAARNIRKTQRGFVPSWLNFKWSKERTYFTNGRYQELRDRLYIGLRIRMFANDTLFNDAPRFFDIVMNPKDPNIEDSQDFISPFLLWVNGIFVPWSKLEVIKSDDFLFMIVKDIFFFDDEIISVKILTMPDRTFMVEDHGPELYDLDPILTFYNDGTVGGKDILVYCKDAIDKSVLLTEPKYDYYELYDVPFNQKLCRDNFIVFNKDGTLDYADYKLEILNGNVLRINDGEEVHRIVAYMYSEDSEVNRANIMNARNVPFTKDLIAEKIPWAEYPKVKDLLLADFDFEHNKKLPYLTNINNSIEYCWQSNQKRYDPVFDKHKKINIMEVSKKTINNVFNGIQTVYMQRDTYKNDRAETFPIVFQSGMVPSWYEAINYTASYCWFIPVSDVYSRIGVHPDETLEFVFCRGIHNHIFDVDKTITVGSSGSLGVHVTHEAIPQGEEVIFMDIGLPDRWFPIKYSRTVINDDEDLLTYDSNEIISESNIYLGATSQFLYKRYDITAGNPGVVTLGSTFKTGFDPDKYMLFINGRYIDRIFWKLFLPKLDNPRITKSAIYTMMALNNGDRVEVFYVGTMNGSRLEFNADLIVKSIKDKAFDDGQTVFKVPYPYRSYPRIYDSFFCIKDNKYVDKSRYVLTSDDCIRFTSESFSFAQDLVFVFPYYRPIWEHDEDNKDDDDEWMYSIYKRNGSSMVTRMEFDKTDLLNYYSDDGYVFNLSDFKVMMYFNSTFIHPDRYDVSDDGTHIVVTMNTGETIYSGVMVTLTFDTEQTFSNEDIEVKAIDVEVTKDKQYVFDIPDEEDYNDGMFVITGSILISPDRYFISDDNKLFIKNKIDYRLKGTTLTFVFIKDKKEQEYPLLKKHFRMGCIERKLTSNITQWDLPVHYLNHFRFNNSNSLLFEDTVAITSHRFHIKGNILYKTNSSDTFFIKGDKLTFMYFYRTYTHHRGDVVYRGNEKIYFQANKANATGTNTVPIPWPIQGIRDTPYLVSIGGDIISSKFYSEDSTRNNLIFNGYSVSSGTEVRFTFCHNGGFTAIQKVSSTETAVSGVSEYNIPSPFYRKVDLRKRMIVTIGTKVLDFESYRVDNIHLKIWITDDSVLNSSGFSGQLITYYFFYTGGEYSGVAAWLPESGYISLLRGKMKTNMNKDLYLMFVNGKKTPKSQIIDITNSLYKVCVDIHRRFDLVMIDCAPRILEFKDKYDRDDDWTKIVDHFEI